MTGISSKEKRQHGSVSIPYSYYECRIPEYFPLVPLHWHKEFEINYVIEGKGEFIYECENEKFITDTGDIMVVLPNRLHAIYPYQDSFQVYDTLVFREEMLGINREERTWVSYIEPMINGTYGIIAPITKANQFYEEMKECIEQIFTYSKKKEPIADLYIKSGLLRFICLLEESGCVKFIKKQEDKFIESIRSALTFVNENYREDICVEQLAAMVHLSKSYFMYCFKRVVGVSPMEYIIQLRIKNACELLRNSNATSIEIAYTCGFQNLSNFNRQFKKCVGYTPKQYRQLQKNLLLKI